jgi:hypothetical protein
MPIWCGIDWAERHHDIALVNDNGKLVAKLRIADDAAGFRALLTLLIDHGAGPDQPVPIAMETSRGLLAAALLGVGYPLYPINPLAVARYRDRYSVSRAKSDAGDAFVLANILRTDPDAHRPLPADTELAKAVRVLARAHQDAVWDRQQIANKIRSLLREYYPSALTAFPDLSLPVAVEVLLLAPTPTAAAKLTVPRVRAALRRAGRQRKLDVAASTILTSLRAEQLHQPPLIEAAMGEQAVGLLRFLSAALTNLTGSTRPSPQRSTPTPTPRSSPACPGSASSWAPGCSARSATTANGSPTPAASRPSPELPPSPAHRAPSPWSQPASCATNDSARSATSGPCPYSRPRQELAPTTTVAGTAATTTAQPHATSPTATSASSTTACTPGRPTTKPKRSRT